MRSPEGGSIIGISSGPKLSLGPSRAVATMERPAPSIRSSSPNFLKFPTYQPPAISAVTSESPVRMGKSFFVRTVPYIPPGITSHDSFFTSRKDILPPEKVVSSKKTFFSQREEVRKGPDTSVKNTHRYRNDSVTSINSIDMRKRSSMIVLPIKNSEVRVHKAMPKTTNLVSRPSWLSKDRIPSSEKQSEKKQTLPKEILPEKRPFVLPKSSESTIKSPMQKQEMLQVGKIKRMEEVRKELRMIDKSPLPVPSNALQHRKLSEIVPVRPLWQTQKQTKESLNTQMKFEPKKIMVRKEQNNPFRKIDGQQLLLQKMQKKAQLSRRVIALDSSSNEQQPPRFQKDKNAAKAFISAGKSAWANITEKKRTGNVLVKAFTVNDSMVSELAKRKNIIDGSLVPRIKMINTEKVFTDAHQVETVLQKAVKDIPPVAVGMGEKVSDSDIKRVLSGNIMNKVK